MSKKKYVVVALLALLIFTACSGQNSAPSAETVRDHIEYIDMPLGRRQDCSLPLLLSRRRGSVQVLLLARAGV